METDKPKIYSIGQLLKIQEDAVSVTLLISVYKYHHPPPHTQSKKKKRRIKKFRRDIYLFTVESCLRGQSLRVIKK